MMGRDGFGKYILSYNMTTSAIEGSFLHKLLLIISHGEEEFHIILRKLIFHLGFRV